MAFWRKGLSLPSPQRVSSPHRPGGIPPSLGSLRESLNSYWQSNAAALVAGAAASPSAGEAEDAFSLPPAILDGLLALSADVDVLAAIDQCLDLQNPDAQLLGVRAIHDAAAACLPPPPGDAGGGGDVTRKRGLPDGALPPAAVPPEPGREDSPAKGGFPAGALPALGAVSARPLLIVLAAAREDDAAVEALRALVALAAPCPENRGVIPLASSLSLRPLLRFLRDPLSGGGKPAELAAHLAFCLAQDRSNRSRLHDSGVVEALVPLLSRGPGVSRWSLKTLCAVASLLSCKRAIVRAGGVPLLAHLVQGPFDGLDLSDRKRSASLALSLLRELADDSTAASQMREAPELLLALAGYLRADGSAEGKVPVLELLIELAESEAWRRELLLEDPLPAVSGHLNSENVRVRKAAKKLHKLLSGS